MRALLLSVVASDKGTKRSLNMRVGTARLSQITFGGSRGSINLRFRFLGLPGTLMLSSKAIIRLCNVLSNGKWFSILLVVICVSPSLLENKFTCKMKAKHNAWTFPSEAIVADWFQVCQMVYRLSYDKKRKANFLSASGLSKLIRYWRWLWRSELHWSGSLFATAEGWARLQKHFENNSDNFSWLPLEALREAVRDGASCMWGNKRILSDNLK